MYELLLELKIWCLDGMHLFSALYLCPSQKAINSRLKNGVHAFACCVWLCRLSKVLMGMTLQMLCNKILQEITVPPRITAQFPLQYMEQHFGFLACVPR